MRTKKTTTRRAAAEALPNVVGGLADFLERRDVVAPAAVLRADASTRARIARVNREDDAIEAAALGLPAADPRNVAETLTFAPEVVRFVDWNAIAQRAQQLAADFDVRFTHGGPCVVTIFWKGEGQ